MVSSVVIHTLIVEVTVVDLMSNKIVVAEDFIINAEVTAGIKDMSNKGHPKETSTTVGVDMVAIQDTAVDMVVTGAVMEVINSVVEAHMEHLDPKVVDILLDHVRTIWDFMAI